MRWLILFAVLIGMYSCNLNPDAPRDKETNTYYSMYVKIYQNYGKVPDEVTLDSLNKYISMFPEEPRGYGFKGYIMCKNQNFNQAKLLFKKALSLDSLNYNALMSLAHIERINGNYTGAKTYLAISEPLDSVGTYILSQKSILKACQGDLDQSKSLSLESLKIDSTNRFAIRNLALIYKISGNDSADNYFELLEKYGPDIQIDSARTVQSPEQLKRYYSRFF